VVLERCVRNGFETKSLRWTNRSQVKISPGYDKLLSPILIAGCGRSGTTAVMNLLATDPRVAFDREYPFENRHLSYYAKLASILENRLPDERFTQDHLFPFEESIFGPRPWNGHNRSAHVDWLKILWGVFSSQMEKSNPAAAFYAEKAPYWLPATARRIVPCSTVYLFRDPRDIYLSSNAFIQARNYYSFGRSPFDTDLDHARNIAFHFCAFFENFSSDRQRTDCLLLRYEDFVVRPEELIGWLQKSGLDPHRDGAFEYFDIHRTSSDLTHSVGRWHREGVPARVNEFYGRHLRRELQTLGYQAESAGACLSVDFAAGTFASQVTNDHGWIERNEDDMIVNLTGGDFGFFLPLERVCAEEVHEIWVSATGCVGDHFSIYWRSTDTDFSEERRIHVNYVPGLHWQLLRFSVWRHPLWKGTIEQIRLDVFNAHQSSVEGRGHVRWVRLIG
jgi:Sulfotransferase family